MFCLGERPVHLLMQINMINWEEAAFPLCQLRFKKGSVERIYTLLNCASFPPAKEGNNDTERRQTVHVHFLLVHNSTEIHKHENIKQESISGMEFLAILYANVEICSGCAPSPLSDVSMFCNVVKNTITVIMKSFEAPQIATMVEAFGESLMTF